MRTCSGCGEQYPETVSVCPACWKPFDDEEVALKTDSRGKVELNRNNQLGQKMDRDGKLETRLSYTKCDSGEESGYAVTGCRDSSAENIVIPDSYKDKPVLKINRAAFKGRTRIRTVCLPEKLREIDDSAFENCTNLHSVYGGAELMHIGEAAFRGCFPLQKMEALGNPNIGCPYSAFAGCYHLPLYPKDK